MTSASVRGVIHRLGAGLDPPADADLLARYARHRDPAAFAELLRRHGPVVLGVCRRVLADPHAADDAFQAVFLVLARKADTIRPPGTVGHWLYGVAVRTARKARVTAARRWRHEMASILAKPARQGGGGGDNGADLERAELRAILDAELARLPEKYRAPVVLCDLGGKTRAGAARDLGWPEGTVAARLHHARKLLAARLTRRGVTLPVAGLGAVLHSEATAAVSPELARVTLAAAEAFAAGTAAAISPAVQTLAEGVMRTLTASHTKLALATILTAGLLTGGGLLWGVDGTKPVSTPTVPLVTATAPPPREVTAVSDFKGPVYSVSYSADGKRFVSVGSGQATVWDSATLRAERTLDAEFAAFSGDGKSLFVLVKDEFRSIDAATGRVRASQKRQKPERTCRGMAVAFAPDGSRFSEFDGSRHHLRGTFPGDPPMPAGQWKWVMTDRLDVPYRLGAAFSPDGALFIGTHYLAPGYPGEAGVLGVWDALTGERLGTIHRGGRGIYSFAWSPDGKQIAVGYGDGVRLYDATALVVQRPVGTSADGVPLYTVMPLKEQRAITVSEPTALAWSADGKTLAVAQSGENPRPPGNGSWMYNPTARDNAVTVLDVASGATIKRVAGFPDGIPILSLAFRPDGQQLVAASGFIPDEVVRVERARRAQTVCCLRVIALDPPAAPPEMGHVSDVRFAPDGTRYGVVAGGRVVVFNAATRKPVWATAGEALGFSPDAKTAFVMGPKVAWHDAATGTVAKEFPRPRAKPFAWHRVAFAPDGTRYATFDGTEHQLHDTATGFEPVRLDGQQPHDPFSNGSGMVAAEKLSFFSPDGKRVYGSPVLKSRSLIGASSGVGAWEAESGSLLGQVKNGGARAAALSCDGKVLAVGYEKNLSLYETGTFKEVKNLGDQFPVTALAFSPDGKTLAAGVRLPIFHGGDVKDVRAMGHKTEVRLIDPATGKVVKVFDGVEGVNHMASTVLPVTALAFSPDGKTLVAGTGVAPGAIVPKDAPRSGEVKVFTVADRKANPERQ